MNAKFLAIAALSVVFFSCDDDNDNGSKLRPAIDYNTVTNETPYSDLFVDDQGNTTVDLSEGNARYKMFQALNYYNTFSVANSQHIDAEQLDRMFTNTGSPFTDIKTQTIDITGAELNQAEVSLSDVTASSLTSAEADAVRLRFESLFEEMEEASHSVGEAAAMGKAGKLGNYLVDDKGIEVAQVIQKSLIGALQLDYIGNVLLDEGLTANNTKAVAGKNYTQLEHNWDEAYGLLTLNQIYLQGSTNEERKTQEFGAGSYIWEYNKANFINIYPAFLKGRAAIVNDDKSELQAQATFIRTEFERTLANAALGYLEKWKIGATDASRAHAIAEGLGFIYSLRFAKIHNADAAFSDQVLNNLIGSANGFWDLDANKINAAADAIKTKFNL